MVVGRSGTPPQSSACRGGDSSWIALDFLGEAIKVTSRWILAKSQITLVNFGRRTNVYGAFGDSYKLARGFGLKKIAPFPCWVHEREQEVGERVASLGFKGEHIHRSECLYCLSFGDFWVITFLVLLIPHEISNSNRSCQLIGTFSTEKFWKVLLNFETEEINTTWAEKRKFPKCHLFLIFFSATACVTKLWTHYLSDLPQAPLKGSRIYYLLLLGNEQSQALL